MYFVHRSSSGAVATLLEENEDEGEAERHAPLEKGVGGQNFGGWANPNCHKQGFNLHYIAHFWRCDPQIGGIISLWHFFKEGVPGQGLFIYGCL